MVPSLPGACHSNSFGHCGINAGRLALSTSCFASLGIDRLLRDWTWFYLPDVVGIFGDGAVAGELPRARHIQDGLAPPLLRVSMVACCAVSRRDVDRLVNELRLAQELHLVAGPSPLMCYISSNRSGQIHLTTLRPARLPNKVPQWHQQQAGAVVCSPPCDFRN
jgi:hypothetical protein